MSAALTSEPVAARGRTALRLLLVLAVALVARLVALPVSTERNMDADSAHLMNVARCFERGQGFSNPAGWPAWMNPARLPMPETFKEPAYPFLMARLAPGLGGEFRAGVWLSLLAGLSLPIASYALARNLGLDPGTATLAALLVAANPLSIFMSVRVMVDSLFPAWLTAGFAFASWRRGPSSRRRPAWADFATGVLIGLAFMTRAQTLLALPAMALVSWRSTTRSALAGGARIAIAALVTASPFLLRNLRLFGTPLYSDVGAYGLWPYVDHLTFQHGLDRPPSPLAFALHHVPAILAHMAASTARFAFYALPGDVAGNPLWVVPLAAGVVLAAARVRTLLGPAVYVACTTLFVFAVNWDARYFASLVPMWALVIALGGSWLARAIGPLEWWGPLRGRHLMAATLAVVLTVQIAVARHHVAEAPGDEIAAVIAEAPFLRAHLAPDESAMVLTTSYYSWFCDRPTVHLVIADEPRFMAVVRRLRVRYVVLPTRQLPMLTARFPDHRLPPALVPDHVDPPVDLTVFAIHDALATPGAPR